MRQQRLGIGGHQSAARKSDSWLTPRPIITALGEFDLDPCASVDQPWPTASRHLTIVEDGLSQPWEGRVWNNPPYSVVSRWMARMARHNHGTALVFARTETEWFHRFVWGTAEAMLFLRSRITFHLPCGRISRYNAGAPSVLIAYGSYDTDRLADCGLDGAFVLLQSASQFIIGIPSTWREVVADAMADGEPARLQEIYERIAGHPKTNGRRHWRDKVRQIVQGKGFERLSKGVYRITPS